MDTGQRDPRPDRAELRRRSAAAVDRRAARWATAPSAPAARRRRRDRRAPCWSPSVGTTVVALGSGHEPARDVGSRSSPAHRARPRPRRSPSPSPERRRRGPRSGAPCARPPGRVRRLRAPGDRPARPTSLTGSTTRTGLAGRADPSRDGAGVPRGDLLGRAVPLRRRQRRRRDHGPAGDVVPQTFAAWVRGTRTLADGHPARVRRAGRLARRADDRTWSASSGSTERLRPGRRTRILRQRAARVRRRLVRRARPTRPRPPSWRPPAVSGSTCWPARRRQVAGGVHRGARGRRADRRWRRSSTLARTKYADGGGGLL